jgi:hypothetical protein
MRLVFAAVALVLTVPTGSHAQSGAMPEYQVKAAFLFNFTRFVTWPGPLPPDTSAPFMVCVAGKDPFGSSLDDIFEGRDVDGRPIAIKRQRLDESPQGCHMLFVAEARAPELRALFGRLDGQSVLTVGDGEEFTRLGGVISLTLQERKVRFAINVQQADRARLKLSAQFLNLATIVQPD